MKIISLLGFGAGVLSLTILLREGLALGFAAPLDLLIRYYERAVDLVLGWAHEPLAELLARLPWSLELQAHWKHILVPMWLYVGADCRVMWRIDRKRAAVFFALIGGLLALVAALAAGAAPIDDPWFRPVLFPVAALFVFNFLQAVWDALFRRRPGKTRWQVFLYYASYFALGNIVLGAVVVAVGMLLRSVHAPGLGLLLILVLVALIALRDLLVSALAVGERRAGDQTWWACFTGMANVQLGAMVLATLGGAIAFLALNAGLSAAGL